MREIISIRAVDVIAGMVAVMLAAWPISAQELERNEHRPVISPDGTQIAFMSTSEATGGDWELFVMDMDGRNLRRLTDNLGWDGYAIWAPDGRSLLFDRSLSSDDENKAAHVLDLQGGAVTRLAQRDGWFSVSDWRGDHQVAFWEQESQRDLYLLDTHGTIIRRLTDTPEISEHDAQISPDGSMIAFASAPVGGGNTHLELLDLGSSERRVLRESAGRIYGVSWAPEGQRIAFTDAPGGDDDDADIFVITLDTGDTEALTSDDSWDHMPVWTRNGTAVVFTSYRSGEERIYLTHGIGTAMRLWAGDE